MGVFLFIKEQSVFKIFIYEGPTLYSGKGAGGKILNT